MYFSIYSRIFKKQPSKYSGFSLQEQYTFWTRRTASQKVLQPSKYSGFTLIELLIYIALLGVMVVIVSDGFTSLNRGRGQTESRSEVNGALRFVVQHIESDIKSAASVATPATAGASGSTLSMTIAGSTVVYDLSGGVLRRTVNVETPEPITGNLITVDSVSFTRIENTNTVLSNTTISLQISITAHYTNASPQTTYSKTITTTVSLR